VNVSSIPLSIDAATSLDGVIERMHAIDAALPRDDGVAYFNRLYLNTTEEVVRSIEGTRFENDEFMTRLDVVFANLYFDAFAADQRGDRVPPAWVPLFEYRERPNTLAVQFALAGMNAHINHDLTVAVVDVCEELVLAPEDDGAHHRDYDRINAILEERQEQIKQWFITGVVASIDDACGRLDDAFACWSITLARRAAWENAQALWMLLDKPRLRSVYLATLSRMVALAGRGFLV
jgi:hypothetical protein